MVQGLERRDVVQNPLANIKPEAGAIPLAPVQSPNPMGGLGEVGNEQRILSNLLDGVGELGMKYFENRKKAWEVEGKMAYAAGKTEAELAKSGNRWNMAGFMSMKAATAANTWKAAKAQEIAEQGHMLDPKAWQAQTKADYSEMIKEVAGADEYTQAIFAAQMDEMLPDLASKQLLANNEWRKRETIESQKSYRASIAISDKPLETKIAELRELTAPGASGLPKADEQKVNMDALLFDMGQGRQVVAKAMLTSQPTDTTFTPARLNSLLSVIQKPESGGDYNVANGTRPVPFTEMTVAQVIEWQKQDEKTNGDKSAAAGAYQFIRSTLEEEVKKNGIDPNAKFDKTLQDQLAVSRLKYRGLNDFATGKITADQFQLALAQEWASLPKDMSGKSFYEADGINKAGIEPGELLNALEASSTNASLTESLLQQGYSLDDIERVSAAHTKLSDARSQEFNAQRVMSEQALLDTAEQTGDLAVSLQKIEVMKTEQGLSESWANGMAGKVVSKVEAYKTNYEKQSKLRTALSTNELGATDTASQKAGMELVRKEAIASLADAQIDPEQKEKLVQDKVRQTAVTNNVVDHITAGKIQNGLSGEVLAKDGTLTPQALAAYGEVVELVKSGGIAYASQYFGNAAELINTALAFDDGNSDSKSALMLAQDIQRRRKTGEITEPSFDPVKIAEGAEKWLESTDPNWMAYLTTKSAVKSGFIFDNLYDIEHQALRKNEMLKSLIKAEATRNVLKNPGQPEEAAITAAVATIGKRAEPAFGNILMSGDASTIREDMGLKGDGTRNLVEGAFGEYIQRNGEKIWGNKYTPTKTFMQSIPLVGKLFTEDTAQMAESRKVPEFSRFTYDPQRKGFIVDLWANVDKTEALGQPRFIPATVVGEYYKTLEQTQKRQRMAARPVVEPILDAMDKTEGKLAGKAALSALENIIKP